MKVLAKTLLLSAAFLSAGETAYAKWHAQHEYYGHPGYYGHYQGPHYYSRGWRPVVVYSAPYPYYVQSDYSEIRCTNSYNPLGLLIGGVAGGAIGSTIGHGAGRAVAIGSGAVMGSILGQNMVQQNCVREIFSQAPVGTPVSWQAGPNEAYAVLPVRDYQENGRYCREYQGYATVGGKRQETYGNACQQPDGSWQIVN